MLYYRLKQWVKGNVKEFATFCLYASVGTVGYLAFDTNIATIRRAEGPSMCPTLNANEFKNSKFQDRHEVFAVRELLANPDFVICSRKFVPQRGDIVLVVDPKNPNLYLIKRLLGLPGDTVVPLGVNQVRKDPVTLSGNQAWVESDAGFGFKDSNIFGPVHVNSIQGKATFALNVMNFSIRSLESIIPSEQNSRLTIK